MSRHFDTIKQYCEILEERANAIWYIDMDGEYVAEINGITFSCQSEAEFEMLCEEYADEREYY